PEALLAAGGGLRGGAVNKGGAGQALPAPGAPELQPGRDPADQLDERVIEQRRAQLEARGHARAVRVGQILPREIELAVPVDESVADVEARARRQRGLDVVVGVEAP